MNYSDNLENKDNFLHISTTLPRSNKASDLIEGLKNKAGYVRCLITDFAFVNGIPEEYPSIPEKERLRKFFGVAIPHEEIRQGIQEWISRISGDKKLLAYVVEYVYFWLKFSPIFLSDRSFICFIPQFVLPNAKKQFKNGVTSDGLEYAFISDMKAFSEQCMGAAPDTNVKAMLEAREKAIVPAERMFIQLVYQWFCFANNDCGYSAEKVADTVLEFMDSYIKYDYSNDMFMAALFTSFVEDKLNAKPAPTPSPVA